MLSGSLWIVCPIQPHFLLCISLSIGSCLVLPLSVAFTIFSGQQYAPWASVDKNLELICDCLGESPCFQTVEENNFDVIVEDADFVPFGQSRGVPDRAQGVECMPGFIDATPDVLICSSILADDIYPSKQTCPHR